ncbi:16S rRNA (cytidine(1402)-2'-O)-methyltransferase [Sphaerobacter sp.]|uniref:16S rRNA (cytidine(1402)-2'-O)-methyltransferase n=1 Tax=Sphaerobacter sp. TaxID=2099654 RepID=UPI001DB536A6|nr:16S rRNA (cytidine(1402)-2'-O)-methyltransferase [Sphaerobacter sp.]MBX5446485.1 16S rRNA (cytidine(1402)-2'-O)-methyltransferase [Sphaerobacter sp.]
MAGTLYLVATPIGNLEDITLRALRILREVSLIAAEDTRHSGRLLKHFGIETPMVSYHGHSGPGRVDEILAALETGDVAVISDAGMPGISDPGFALVRAAAERGIRVEPVPGPSAVIAAVAASGLVPGGFLFLGFPPRRPSERRKLLASLADLPYPLVLYEAPHRLRATLADLAAVLGNRPVALCRELTKVHEEITRTTLAAAHATLEERPPRGEYVVVVGAPERDTRTDPDQATDLLRDRLAAGESPSAAARAVARATGLPRSDLYRQALALREGQANDEPPSTDQDTGQRCV